MPPIVKALALASIVHVPNRNGSCLLCEARSPRTVLFCGHREPKHSFAYRDESDKRAAQGTTVLSSAAEKYAVSTRTSIV
jgi:hypothetical protein